MRLSAECREHIEYGLRETGKSRKVYADGRLVIVFNLAKVYVQDGPGAQRLEVAR